MNERDLLFRGLSRRATLASTLLLGASGCASSRRQAFEAPASSSLYDMSVRLDPDARRMEVSGLARLPPSPSPRTELKFILAPAASNVVLTCSDGDGANAVEAVEILSETPGERLPEAARARLGLGDGQKNVLVRVVLRHPSRTLTREEANDLRNRIFDALHCGSDAGAMDVRPRYGEG